MKNPKPKTDTAAFQKALNELIAQHGINASLLIAQRQHDDYVQVMQHHTGEDKDIFNSLLLTLASNIDDPTYAGNTILTAVATACHLNKTLWRKMQRNVEMVDADDPEGVDLIGKRSEGDTVLN